jgi:hypothetical protein
MKCLGTKLSAEHVINALAVGPTRAGWSFSAAFPRGLGRTQETDGRQTQTVLM